MMQQRKLNQLWLKGAVIGSIWAAFEIIVGSFLHNMRFPLSGTLLASASVFLLVSFMQVWKDRGVILRAGLICALMKSISPSAVILGPMIGIFLEALILEMVVRLAGRNLLAYIIGGALAVSSTLVQKLVGLLITFGFDLVAIAKPFYFYLVKVTKLDQVNPEWLIWGVVIIYLLLGGLAALWGYWVGKRYNQAPHGAGKDLTLAPDDPSRFSFSDEPENEYPFLTILALFVGMVGSMWLINFQFVPYGIFIGLMYIILIVIRYRHSLGRLKKIAIWIQFFLITVIAAIFWEWSKSGQLFSWEGLIVGLKMNYRAVIVILGFTAISIELRSPLVRALLTRKGFSSLYNSLNLAFTALPSIVQSLPKGNDLTKKHMSVVSSLLAQAENLLGQFNLKNNQFDHVFIITGGVHEGKTTFAEEIVRLFQSNHQPIEGFLSIGTFVNDKRFSFDVKNVSTGASRLLCSIKPERQWLTFGKYYFDPEVIAWGNQLLKNINPASMVVIDEVGNLEFKKKKGWFDGLSHVLSSHPTTFQIWVVRRDYIPTLQELFPIPELNIFDIKESTPKNAYQSIVSKMAIATN